MKITLTAPETEYRATIDTEATRVDIREAFIGAMFISPDGETLAVFHRDSGYEVSYQAAGYRPVRELELKGDRITVDGTEVQWLPPKAWEGTSLETYVWQLLGAASRVMLPDDQVMPSEELRAIVDRLNQDGPLPQIGAGETA